MRYLLTIFFIIFASTAGIIWLLKPTPQSATGSVISVNKRHISKKELSPLLAAKQIDDQDIYGIIDTVIARELLIQEAKSRKIDQEEPFRKSLQSFYEQSLIKTLIDQEANSFTYTPSSEEVAAYRQLLHKKIDISLLPEEDKRASQKNQVPAQVDLNEHYTSLTPPLQMAILTLQLGKQTRHLRYEDGTYNLRVNSVSDAEEPSMETISEDEAKRAVTSFRRDEHLKNWLEDLENKADIKFDKDKL